MTDEDTISKVAKLLRVSYAYHKPRKAGWKPVYSTHVRGKRARELMTVMLPLMSVRRQSQINEALQSYNPMKIQRRWLHNQKLNDTMLLEAKQRIDGGESLRSVARSYTVHHESLRRRVLSLTSIDSDMVVL